MFKGEIGDEFRQHVAVMFEGLLANVSDEIITEQKKHWWSRTATVPQTEDEWVAAEVRRWRPNELPIKNVIDLTQRQGIGVDVYSYYDPVFKDHIEHWLARKGAHCNVYCYENLEHLASDFRYDRGIHTLFTPSEEDAGYLGLRACVVGPNWKFL